MSIRQHHFVPYSFCLLLGCGVEGVTGRQQTDGGSSLCEDAGCALLCGNGKKDLGETCDPPSTCPASCNDGNACTIDVRNGSFNACNVACTYVEIGACENADGCCPPGCTRTNDSDCAVDCGNGRIDEWETCDPPSSCPTGCDDHSACTEDTLIGNALTCTASCSHQAIPTCDIPAKMFPL